MKVLIVDDDFSNRFLLQTILEKNGFTAIQATNGENALEILRSQPIDLIISDILMPVMDGYHLCQECKADKTLRHIPFIFCSGTYTDEQDAQLSLKFGAAAFIAKPLEPQQLLETISHVLNHRGSQRADLQKTPFEKDTGVYKLYSERLVNKLEEKMQALDKEKMALEMEVAERRRIEQELRKSRNFAENLFNTAPGLMLILDPEGRIIRFNPYMEKVSGYRLEEVNGRFWNDVFSPEDATKNTPAPTETDDGHPSGNISTITTKDGKKKKIIWFDSTLKNEGGQTLGLLAVGQDITRQLESQKQAIDARVQQTVKELVCSFSEKLDTIAAILLDHMAFLKKTRPVPDKTGEQIQQLEKAFDYTTALADQLEDKN